MIHQKVQNSQFLRTIKKWTERFLIVIISLCVSYSGFSQSRNDLEQKRNRIIEELEIANTQVKLAEKNTQVTIEELSAINSQIKKREELISALNNQLKLAEQSLSANRDSLSSMNKVLLESQESYAQVMRLAYIRQKASNPWLSIFSSTSINEAILSWRYANQFQSFIKQKEQGILQVQNAIKMKNESILEESKYTKEILQEEKINKQKLADARKSKDDILSDLKEKENEVKEERNKKKAERESLNRKIEQIILAELSAKNKRKKSSSSNSLLDKKYSLPWPVNGYISSPFGKQAHPTIKNLKISNNGVDIDSRANAVVKVVAEGTVVGVTNIPGFDIMIIVEHGAFYSVYSKIAETNTKKGQFLSPGESIGQLGTGGKLHFEIWKGKTKLDPAVWLKKK